ncbi:hypothetical protein C8F01DRAFT_462739 [Mycena amicta]|nr:hypothetical protein C8F01DRAFT_462739 [Mycena amicta]
MNFDEENWLAYCQANLLFAEAALKQITPGAMVRVQDYHLMLMPMLLRGLLDGGNSGGDMIVRELANILRRVSRRTTVQPNPPRIFLASRLVSSSIHRSRAAKSTVFSLFGARFCLASFTVTSSASTRTTVRVISCCHVHAHWLCRRRQMVSSLKGGWLTSGRSLSALSRIRSSSMMTQIRQLESRFSGVKAIVGMTPPPANCTLVSAHIDELHVAASVGFKTAKVDQGVLFRSSQTIRTSMPA